VDDLGRFLAALGTPFEARGGAFRYAGTARLDQPGLPFEGTLSADRFTLTRSTLLTRVVNLTAIMGLRHALAGDGIAFDEMHGRLSQRGGTLELQEGIAVGRVMALHLEGTWDLPQNRCDAQGDLVPSYWGLNRMVSKIPLVGALAGGATGIQAFHFRARGTASNPAETDDPLRSLAPGALRTVWKRLVP
jgi:hypothetical protein